jgi:uncharacterized protein (TIGR03000 family)
MSRIILAASIVLTSPVIAYAGPPGGGGGLTVKPFGVQFQTGRNPVAGVLPFNYHGAPGFPFAGVWGGFGGDMSPSLYFALYGVSPPGYTQFAAPSALTLMPRSMGMGMSLRAEAPRPTPTAYPVAVSNASLATVHLELPAPGQVWANGDKSQGKPTTEWTLSSPGLNNGQPYTFEVKARWEVDGKAYEYSRTVLVEGGKTNRVSVLSGTPVASRASVLNDTPVAK